MMGRRRAGMAVAVAVAVLLALSSSCGVASARGPTRTRKPPAKKTLPAGQKPPAKSKFFPLTPGRFGHKRNYEASCADEGGPSCYVGCPSDCPKSCLVFCEYCLAFCGTCMHACLSLKARYIPRTCVRSLTLYP